MTSTSARGWLRQNAFVVAAVLLPVVVVGLFIVASVIPGYRVADPQYDLLFTAQSGYNPSGPRVVVDVQARNGRVEVDLRPAAPTDYPAMPILYLYDHNTGDVREVPLNLPAELPEGAGVQTLPVEALAGRRVIAQERAPDGYTFEVRSGRAPGIVGDIFGMHRYNQDVVIVNDGRVIPLPLPSAVPYATRSIGWLGPEGG